MFLVGGLTVGLLCGLVIVGIAFVLPPRTEIPPAPPSPLPTAQPAQPTPRPTVAPANPTTTPPPPTRVEVTTRPAAPKPQPAKPQTTTHTNSTDWFSSDLVNPDGKQSDRWLSEETARTR